jgi:PAS domain S-box-containing protein
MINPQTHNTISYHRNKSPWITLFFMLVATFILTLYVHHDLQDQVYHKFQVESQRIVANADKLLGVYIDMMRGVQGLYAASKSVERDEFVAYAKSINFDNRYLGITGIRYVERITRESKNQFITEVQSDRSIDPDGYADFAIFPPGDRDVYYVVKYAAPPNQRKILGYDTLTEEMRKRAYTRAIEIGKASSTGRITLVEDVGKNISSFAIVAPIYRNGSVITTSEDRKSAIQGFVSIVFRLDHFVAQFMPKETLNKFALDIYDEEKKSNQLLYTSPSSFKGQIFEWSTSIDVAGRTWILNFRSQPKLWASKLERFGALALLLSGLLISFLVFAFLLSLQNQLTQDFRESEERYRQLVELSPYGIFIQLDNKYFFANTHLVKLLGMKGSDELIGKPVLDFIHPDFQAMEKERLKTLKEERKEVPLLEEKLIRKDGSIIDVEIGAVPFYQQGKLGAQGVIRDITERKHIEAQLFQFQKMESLGQLAAGVAHEINNPLAVILGFAQGALKRIQAGDDLELPLKSIERETLRCKHLVQELLTFSRTSHAETKEELNLNEVIDGALSLVIAQGRVKDVALIKDYANDIPPFLANKTQMQQVIINLCTNALDAMPKGGRLTIKTSTALRQGQECAEIEVRDTGEGVPPEIVSKIFDPFFTTKEPGKGTGLGLSLVYEIVKKHTGEINVMSEPGKGTFFCVTLPMFTKV